MSSSYQLEAVPRTERSASTLDVALLFAGANVVASTLITGGTLASMGGSTRQLMAFAVVGVVLGTAPIAILARLGPRTGLPSMVLLRRPFGVAGASLISALLVVTNFAWIALNNVVAAQAMKSIVGGSEWHWSLAVGALATVLALGGERLMALFDRVAVPMLALLGVLLTWRLLSWSGAAPVVASKDMASLTRSSLSPLLALDLVIGYQVSWSLMFADYTRFQARARQASRSVLLGLTASSVWLMSLGLAASRRTGGSANDPTSMVLGLGLPVTVLLLVALSTITTNFVNLYLSGLAVRNLAPTVKPTPTVIAIGSIGTALGIVSGGFLDRYAAFMGVLATLLLPIVAIALVHFFLLPRRPGAAQFDANQLGMGPSTRRWGTAAMVSWMLGCLVYQSCVQLGLGATLPTLLVTAICYRLSAERVDGLAT